jgi:hypothetical protein
MSVNREVQRAVRGLAIEAKRGPPLLGVWATETGITIAMGHEICMVIGGVNKVINGKRGQKPRGRYNAVLLIASARPLASPPMSRAHFVSLAAEYSCCYASHTYKLVTPLLKASTTAVSFLFPTHAMLNLS